MFKRATKPPEPTKQNAILEGFHEIENLLDEIEIAVIDRQRASGCARVFTPHEIRASSKVNQRLEQVRRRGNGADMRQYQAGSYVR